MVHKERKNMGMTYVYIIRNQPEEKIEEEDEEESKQEEKS